MLTHDLGVSYLNLIGPDLQERLSLLVLEDYLWQRYTRGLEHRAAYTEAKENLDNMLKALRDGSWEQAMMKIAERM